MRAKGIVILAAAAMLTAVTGFGQVGDLSLTLDSDLGSGSALPVAPDGAPPCLPPACVLFSGTLLETDNDPGAYVFLSDPTTGLADITLTLSTSPASGGLTLDNTFTEVVPGVLSGDPNWFTDENLPDVYTGPIFGIDIAPSTTVGVYTGTVTFVANGGDGDPNNEGFDVSQQITVMVTPEPATLGFAITGLAALGAGYGFIRKWRSSEASR